MKTPNKHRPVQIGDILESSLKSYRKKNDLGMIKIWDMWEDAVGKNISENAKPAAFKGDVLLIHVNSSPWMHHLQFLKQDIINKVNSKMGKEMVTEIKFKIENF